MGIRNTPLLLVSGTVQQVPGWALQIQARFSWAKASHPDGREPSLKSRRGDLPSLDGLPMLRRLSTAHQDHMLFNAIWHTSAIAWERQNPQAVRAHITDAQAHADFSMQRS